MNGREIQKSLERKGWRKRHGDHVHYRYVTTEGKVTSIRTKVSHGHRSRQLGRGLVAQMAQQCRLDVIDFEELVGCSLSQTDFEEKMRATGAIRDEPSS